MGLVPLLLGIVALTSKDDLATLISYIPGTSKIEQIVDLSQLIHSSAIFLIVLGIVIVGIGLLGCCGACFKAKWMLYLVSNRHIVVVLLLLVVSLRSTVLCFISLTLETQVHSFVSVSCSTYSTYVLCATYSPQTSWLTECHRSITQQYCLLAKIYMQSAVRKGALRLRYAAAAVTHTVCRAMLCKRCLCSHAVSVCPSVRHLREFCQNE